MSDPERKRAPLSFLSHGADPKALAYIAAFKAKVERLTAERDGLAKALDELGRYADDSIGTAYGTISASWLRRYINAALDALPKEADDA